jgi:hypothetical protein
MKTPPLAVALLLALFLPACIYVRVRGDLSEELFDEDESLFYLTDDLGGVLEDPEYDLELDASPWGTEAVWTVRYAGGQTDEAFTQAKEAVLRRIAREGGEVTETRDDGPGRWDCDFRIDGEPGEASVRVLDDARDPSRPHRLEIRWEESD